jgi:holo-[acyl-carrier protein] synthase
MILGTGVDVVEIPRIRKITEKLTDRFIHRVFTPSEQQYCRAYRDPAPHFAVRFAAKEALFKALGTGWAKGITWLDVEVLKEEQEAPNLVLHGEALRLSEAKGAKKIHLSLSHTDQSAIAMVILEG